MNQQMPDGFFNAFSQAWYGVWTFLGLILGGALPFIIVALAVLLVIWLLNTFSKMVKP